MTRLLFVDDEANVLSGLQRLLRPYRRQWEMTFALGGARALEILAEDPVDVIVTDVRMPGMDGVELLRVVRERYPAMVRIVLSGQVDPESAISLTTLAHQFLSKPCEPETLVGALTRATTSHTALSDVQLRRALGHLEALPSPRPVVEQLTAVLAQPDATIDDVVGIVANDPAMTVKVLQLVNSAFFGLPHQARTVREAVVFLGLDMLRNLVTATDIFHGFEDPLIVDPDFLDDVRSECLAVAERSRDLAPPEAESDAYLAGLVHDVGMLALAACRPEKLAELFDAARDGGSFLTLEREVFGTGHAEIGAHLLRIWGLSNTIVEAVAFHHAPEQLPADAMVGRIVSDAVRQVGTLDNRAAA
ncbi:MAG TPA: response regulator [Acidimicrobiia bacterium]|nr:response regulator [Acidimicrobiia bacterium]